MIKAIALDDEPLALKIIENFCSKIDFVILEKIFNKQSEAARYLKKFPVDLIFLDIQMPQKNGLDFYKNIDQNTKVIFTTAFPNYAVDAFEVNAVDYLLKPFSLERFTMALEKLKENHQKPNADILYIRADYKLHKINFQDIIFVEALDDYVKIYLENEPPIMARLTLKNLQNKLPESLFLRVHRSFLVSINKIKNRTQKNINLEGNEIPIGEKFREEIAKRLQ